MRIVVTGASGNVGTALLRRIGNRHIVVGVSRRRPPAVAPYGDAQWAEVDISADDAARRLSDVFSGADAVVHLAWLIQPGHDRNRLRRTNQGGTRAVADAVTAAGVPHLVHMSSTGTYAAAPRGAWADESWPTTGVPTSSYSVDKAAAERIVAGRKFDLSVTRPTLILQPEAASEISRYFIGPLVPAGLVRPSLMRLVPWPTEFVLQLVHAEDVADALVRIVERRALGAFNLAAAPVLDRAALRLRFGGLGPPAPLKVVRAAAAATWRARLQPTDEGWIDLAASVPLLDTSRARAELDWAPAHRGDDVLDSFLQAMHERRGHAGPLLHQRRA